MAVTAPDTLGDLRAWLRTQPDLAALHAGRVFFRLPDYIFGPGDKAYQQSSTPALRLYRAGGGLRPSTDLILDDARVAVEIWGAKGSDYQTVRQLATAVGWVLQTAPGGLINPAGESWLVASNVTSVTDAPDPETGWPRVVVHASVTVTWAAAQD